MSSNLNQNIIRFLLILFISGHSTLKADKEVDSLMKVIAVNNTDTVLLKAYNRIATRYYMANEIDSVKKYTFLLKAKAAQSQNLIWNSNVYNHFGNIHRYYYNYDSSLYYYKKAIKVSLENVDIVRLAHVFNNLGLLFENYAKWNSAVKMFSTSASLFQLLHDLRGEANSYNNLGNIYEMIGEYPKSLDYHFKAYSNYKLLNNPEGLARSSNNIANIYSDQKDYAKAKEYYRISLRYCAAGNNPESTFLTYVNLGINFSCQNENDSAEINFISADTVLNKNYFYYLKPNFLETRGEFEIKRKNYNAALDYYNEAVKAAVELGDSLQIPYTKCSLGNLYLELKDYKKAEAELLLAEQLLKRFNTSDLEININNSLKILYEQLNKPAKAYYYYKKYVLADKKRDEQNSQRYAEKAELKHQFETELVQIKKVQDERDLKRAEEKKRQNMILLSVSFICLLIVVFSFILFKRFKESEQQKKIIATQKQEVELQHHALEEKNKEILDSINYAKRIQQALLAHEELLSENLQDYFVFFKPKDIVSGDFYWATSTGSVTNRKFYLAVCDSTGHGVPGAFMSLLNINLLNEAINEKHIVSPNEVFNHVREGLIKNISQEGQRDGMDGILLQIENSSNGLVQLNYAAANNAPVLISKKQIIELPKDKMPVGIGITQDSFKLQNMNAQKGDMLYLYTDGYADQFGGPKGKKFKYKTLNELLVSISDLPTSEQKQKLNIAFEEWRGNLEQVDDVCIIGIRI